MGVEWESRVGIEFESPGGIEWEPKGGATDSKATLKHMMVFVEKNI